MRGWPRLRNAYSAPQPGHLRRPADSGCAPALRVTCRPPLARARGVAPPVLAHGLNCPDTVVRPCWFRVANLYRKRRVGCRRRARRARRKLDEMAPFWYTECGRKAGGRRSELLPCLTLQATQFFIAQTHEGIHLGPPSGSACGWRCRRISDCTWCPLRRRTMHQSKPGRTLRSGGRLFPLPLRDPYRPRRFMHRSPPGAHSPHPSRSVALPCADSPAPARTPEGACIHGHQQA